MTPRLPPEDPHESLGMEPSENVPVPTEAAIFLAGSATEQEDRLSRAILAVRPGVLIVANRG